MFGRRKNKSGGSEGADEAATGNDAAPAEAERERIAAGKRRGVLLDGLARHFATAPTAHGVLVGYAGCSRSELAECVPTLVDLTRTRHR